MAPIVLSRPQTLETILPLQPAWSEILTAQAMQFLGDLSRTFDARRCELLERRRARQRQLDQGVLPDFPTDTAEIRNANWTVAPIPPDLSDRRVEITGPVDRKMVINALNSGANVFMADFEDANSPTWANALNGQLNLRDAIRRNISFKTPEGKEYTLVEKPAVLMIRPRGWHLVEKHMLVDGAPISGSLFDFGLYFFHNAKELLARGTGPYFYLPKLESRHEARLWNDVFLFAQERLGVPRGSIRATVLIETILASFEMDEILYELREHSAGLNCGRWDYIFSFIKKFRARPDFVLPDRSEVTMDRHFLKSYVDLLIKTCHRRQIHAMGGMAAQIPIKSDPDANEKALARVRADKEREAHAGHDGTWVAHPGLVPVAKEVFDRIMPGPNQIGRSKQEVNVTANDLLTVPSGKITEHGLRWNIDVGIQYMESWLRGSGCVPIYNLMEDAATAEICRAQVWQWAKFNCKLEDGRAITVPLITECIGQQLSSLEQKVGKQAYEQGQYRKAGELLSRMMTSAEFPEFLTLIGYENID